MLVVHCFTSKSHPTQFWASYISLHVCRYVIVIVCWYVFIKKLCLNQNNNNKYMDEVFPMFLPLRRSEDRQEEWRSCVAMFLHKQRGIWRCHLQLHDLDIVSARAARSLDGWWRRWKTPSHWQRHTVAVTSDQLCGSGHLNLFWERHRDLGKK